MGTVHEIHIGIFSSFPLLVLQSPSPFAVLLQGGADELYADGLFGRENEAMKGRKGVWVDRQHPCSKQSAGEGGKHLGTRDCVKAIDGRASFVCTRVSTAS